MIIGLLYAQDEDKSEGGLIFIIVFRGFLYCIGVYGFIFDPKNLTFYLEQYKDKNYSQLLLPTKEYIFKAL